MCVGGVEGLLIIYIFLYCLSSYVMNKNIFCNLNKKAMTSKENISVVNYHLKKKKKKKRHGSNPNVHLYLICMDREDVVCMHICIHACVCLCVCVVCNITQPLKK